VGARLSLWFLLWLTVLGLEPGLNAMVQRWFLCRCPLFRGGPHRTSEWQTSEMQDTSDQRLGSLQSVYLVTVRLERRLRLATFSLQTPKGRSQQPDRILKR
jgi:hypothetical protein